MGFASRGDFFGLRPEFSTLAGVFFGFQVLSPGLCLGFSTVALVRDRSELSKQLLTCCDFFLYHRTKSVHPRGSYLHVQTIVICSFHHLAPDLFVCGRNCSLPIDGVESQAHP